MPEGVMDVHPTHKLNIADVCVTCGVCLCHSPQELMRRMCGGSLYAPDLTHEAGGGVTA